MRVDGCRIVYDKSLPKYQILVPMLTHAIYFDGHLCTTLLSRFFLFCNCAPPPFVCVFDHARSCIRVKFYTYRFVHVCVYNFLLNEVFDYHELNERLHRAST